MTTDSDEKCPQCGRPTNGGLCTHCAIRDALDFGSVEDPTRFEGEPGDDARDDREKRYGPYRVIRVLGEGGFGIVYLALQTAPIKRHVALKVLKKGIGSGKHLLARFELERQALARMDHPSICRVYDAGASTAGEPYFVMEVVEGRPITRYCQETKLPLPKVLALFREVCSAVEHAHQRGVIHRDLKPSNILITERDGEPHPVIIDFGIAKAMEPLLVTDTILTNSFQIIGTPAYMSPEQAESGGHDADVRSDVYALGTVLYELLTGRPPISMEELRKVGISAALRMIQEADIPPPSRRLTLGGADPVRGDTTVVTRTITARRLRGELDWITMRSLAKDRARRYQSARDLSEDLGRFANGMPILAGPPGLIYRARKFTRRHPAAIAAGAAALFLGIFWLGAREVTAAATARIMGERLLAADQSAAPFLIAEASPHLSRLQGDLLRVADDRKRPLQARINAALALASGDNTRVSLPSEFLIDEANPALTPEQAIALQTSVLRDPEQVPAHLAGKALQIACSPSAIRERRLSAIALLAAADPAGALWPDLAPEIARLICGAGTVPTIRWAPVLAPVAPRILDPIEHIFSGESKSPAGMCAAILLGAFHAGDAATLAELAASATPEQFQHLSPAILQCGDEARAIAARMLAEDAAAPDGSTEDARDASALRRARAAMMLLLFGDDAKVRPLLFREDWADPRVRTFAIHSFAECGVFPSIPATRLAETDNVSERAALLLALGGYTSIELGPALLASTSATATTLLRSDPSAEVHSAADWLLRVWGQPATLDPKPPPGPVGATSDKTPTWLHDSVVGLDFAVIEGPVEFPMGSPESEPGRSSDEFRHAVEIPYRFAIATKTLAFDQVKALLPGAYDPHDQSPGDFPARRLSLNTARRLCNAVSSKAGIPMEQWCYTEDDAPLPKENITSLAGYRFPTEEEWEYSCRGGSSAPRPYGYSDRLLAEYACYSYGDGGGVRPPGSKRPNGYGMFDMLGNLQNFVEGNYGPYPGGKATNPPTPRVMIGLSDGSFDLPSRTLLRGQTESNSPRNFRSAKRSGSFYPPDIPVDFASLRLARTLPPQTPSP